MLTLDLLCFFFPCLVSPRRSSVGPGNEAADSEFPGQHFQGDLFLLALGSSQRDLFEDDWLDVMVRVYWLKARFLALQVGSLLCFSLITFYFTQCRQMWLVSLSCLLSGRHGVGPGELRCMYRPVAEQTKVSWRETLHHQLAKPSRRCSNLCGRGQCMEKKTGVYIIPHNTVKVCDRERSSVIKHKGKSLYKMDSLQALQGLITSLSVDFILCVFCSLW